MYAIKVRILMILYATLDVSLCTFYIKNGENLNSIPDDILNTTTQLYLKGNNISQIYPGELINVPYLNRVDLSNNKFVAFPFLCDLGSQLLTLSLRSNALLSVLLEERLDCLTELINIDLSGTALNGFPDLTPIGDTLKILYLSNLRLSYIEPSHLASLTKVWLLDLSSNNFSSVPDLSPVGATLTHLWIRRNIIDDIPATTWRDMAKLTQINLENNKLQSFPDFRLIAGTLKNVYLDFNPIANISIDVVLPLVNLQKIGIGGSSLSELPDLGSFGDSLIHIRIQSANLLAMPALRNMSALQMYSIRNNEFITSIPGDYFLGWNSLEGLDLSYVPLALFPNLEDVADTLQSLYIMGTKISHLPVDQMARLSSLEFLDVRKTNIQIIPSTCALKPKSLVIDARSSILDLCHCDNLWLKYGQKLGMEVKADGGILCKGEDWGDLNTEQLRNTCQGYNGTFRYTVPSVSLSNSFCGFPLASVSSDRSRLHCTKQCLDSPGCITFNFRRNAMGATCVIIAPPIKEDTLDLSAIGAESTWNLEFLKDITFY